MDCFLNGLFLLLRFSTLPEHSECLKNVACKNERRRPCFFIWKQICNIVNFIRSLFLWCILILRKEDTNGDCYHLVKMFYTEDQYC